MRGVAGEEDASAAVVVGPLRLGHPDGDVLDLDLEIRHPHG